MTHEKIIKRENGDSVLIKVTYTASRWDNNDSYGVQVAGREKNKKTWIFSDTWKYATHEEILQAKLELWEKMKPM